MRPHSVVLAVMVAGATSTAVLAQSATQTLNLEVQTISVLALAPGSPILTVTTAEAGAANTDPATAVSAYDLTNNEGARKIIAALDTSMPAGMLLTTHLAAVGGGVSAGPQTLGTTAVDVVTAIGAVSATGAVINYTLTVPALTLPMTGSRIVTYTVTAG